MRTILKTMARSDESSRHGKMKSGFTRQNLQLPDELAASFRAEASRLGAGGVKDAGTLLVLVWMGMPDQMRRALYFWFKEQQYDNSANVTAAVAWGKVVELLQDTAGLERASADDLDPTHYVDRLVTPELAQPPVQRLVNKLRQPPPTKKKTAG